jgi:hypothetical protein
MKLIVLFMQNNISSLPCWLISYIMNDMKLHNALTENPFTVRNKC